MKVDLCEPGADTTLKDLMAKVSDVAFEHAAEPEEAYEIARLVLLRILKDASLKRKWLTGQFSAGQVSSLIRWLRAISELTPFNRKTSSQSSGISRLAAVVHHASLADGVVEKARRFRRALFDRLPEE